MKIAGIQKLSMVDYPGKMACTIFFPGCNFRCPYCHNKSLVIPEPDQGYMDEEEVLKFLEKRQGLLDGVCITGGEALLQGENLIPFLKKIRGLGYTVKLDTNGTSPAMLKQLCEDKLVDYVAMDIKNSRENYHAAAGKPLPHTAEDGQEKACPDTSLGSVLDKVQESVRYLMKGCVEYEFRTTLVKGIHTQQDIEKICHWIRGARIWYLQNFKDSGHILNPNSCPMEPFSENEMKLFEKTAKEHKLNAVVRNV